MSQTSEGSGRRIGRPRASGPEADNNPLSALTQDERRALFLGAAARLFESRGYSETSVEDITRELGFTRGIFYYYWRNKREVVQEIHDRALALINARLDEVVARESSPAARLEGAIGNHVEAVIENRSIISVLLGNFEFSEGTLEGRREYARRFQELVEDGIAAGVVREMDPRILTFSILGLCNSVAQWYEPGGKLSAAEIRNLFASFAADGWRGDSQASSEQQS